MPKNQADSSTDPLAALRERVKKSPLEPGVYRWLNKNGDVLYVGKAKSLRKRLAQYVAPAKGNIGPWRQSFLRQITDFDVTVTNTELEALVLETHLIKQLRPKYNVLMKDDKNYVYIRISVQDAYPRVDIVRKMWSDGAKYFGPKTTAEEARTVLDLLRKIYPFRTCKMDIVPAPDAPLVETPYQGVSAPDSIDGGSGIRLEVVCTHKDRKTPCLDFHIEQCSAPCVGRRTPEEYRAESIDGVIEFLKGDEGPVKKLLREKMAKAAADKKFEIAAQLRNHLQYLERKKDDVELVSDTSGDDSDVIGVTMMANRSHVVVFHRRGGRIIGEHSYNLVGAAESAEEVASQFLAQFYDDAEIPSTIIVGEELAEHAVLQELLTARRGRKVQIVVPERGKKSGLLVLAEKNAQQKARQQEAKWEADQRNTENALEDLKERLNLPSLPERIEGYDISHLGGTETVGSMVVMRKGKTANDHYRSFTIRTLKRGEIDDYWALREVLTRRLRYLSENLAKEEEQWKEQGVSFGRVRKDEAERVKDIALSHCHESEEQFDVGGFLVARREEGIVATVQCRCHTENASELRCTWADADFAQTMLPRFMVRKTLKGLKKGKMYAVVPAMLEMSYGGLGFRYVKSCPKPIEERRHQLQRHYDEELIVMMYEAAQNKADPSFTSVPDLLVIDGGKGQLSTVVDVLRKLKLQIPVIGLAKREEDVFVPDQAEPVTFGKDSPAKFLLMRLRDEAHRSANRHREGRGLKAVKASVLDDVPGIGAETKAALLKRFKTISAMRSASDQELGEYLNENQLGGLRDRIGRGEA